MERIPPVILLKGGPIAQKIRDSVAADVAKLKARGVHPHLAFITPRGDPGAEYYADAQKRACEKAGIGHSVHVLSTSHTQDELLRTLTAVANDPKVTGIIVHSPMPAPLDLNSARLLALPPDMDVEAVLPQTYGRLAAGVVRQVPCTADAALELMKASGVAFEGREAVIVGRSVTVGRPLALLLLNDRKGPTVTVCHSATADLPSHTKRADFLITAIGKPGFVTAEMVKPGAVVIDVGTNAVKQGDGTEKTTGDVDFDAVAAICGAITPVPGGVGPVTTACLLRNVVNCAKFLFPE
jgi:methylenetetrahydrofolate dehydrogenase (NADP+)/methenyltetrahydrofolate cyclohydrolase